MKAQRISVGWRPRQQALTPCAVAAQGISARTLARHLLNRSGQRLALLRGVAGDDILLLLGAEEHLPWLPGLQYLGIALDAPKLLLPSNLEPDVPCALLQQALLAQHPCAQLAVLAGSKEVLAAEHARALQKDRLQRWLESCR